MMAPVISIQEAREKRDRVERAVRHIHQERNRKKKLALGTGLSVLVLTFGFAYLSFTSAHSTRDVPPPPAATHPLAR